MRKEGEIPKAKDFYFYKKLEKKEKKNIRLSTC